PPPPVPLCRTLLRIRNSKEEWLSGAEVKVNTPFQHRYSADECGRVMINVKSGSDVKGTVTVDGYHPREFSFSCPQGRNEQEQLLILEEMAK
ncbi:MAG: hypothetical protein AB1898_32535, partial [Acidobacteriota bacterium]